MDFFELTTDVLFTYDEDIDFANGDIMLTSGMDSMKRDIFKLLITEAGDWDLYPNEGASPNTFIGEHNTRENAKLLENHLVEKIQAHVRPATVTAKVVPISRESIKVYLEVNLANQDIVNIPFSMDFVNGFIYPEMDNEVDTLVSSKNTRYNSSDSIKHPNPIWDRMRTQ